MLLKNSTEIKAFCATLFVSFMVLQYFCGACFSFHICKLANTLKQYFNWGGESSQQKLHNGFHPSSIDFGKPSLLQTPYFPMPFKRKLNSQTTV